MVSSVKYYFGFVVDKSQFCAVKFLGTKFCESLLLPTEKALKRSLEATLVNANIRTDSDEKYQIDACCRSLYKCDAYKRVALNQTNDLFWNIRPCDCIELFQICLVNLDSSLSNEIELLHSINTTKCYTSDYPIIHCKKWESYPEGNTPILRFVNQAEREKFFNRCTKYELDKSRPKQIQLRDVPFNHHERFANNMSQNAFNTQKCKFFSSRLTWFIIYQYDFPKYPV